MLWRLIWCFGAASTALGRFFRVGWFCSVPDFNGFLRVVQSAGWAFCVEIMTFQKRTLRGCVWMLSFFSWLALSLWGVVALVVAGCVCGGCGGA